MEGALAAFNTFIEQYASSNKVPYSMSLKGCAQLRQEKRTAAIQTFDALYKKYPSTEAARKGRDLRRSLSPATTSRKKR